MALPGFAARFATVRWRVAWDVAKWLFRQGRSHRDKNLDKGEQRELWELRRRSKGRRANLSGREQRRFGELVKQGVRGSGGS
jgi:hypothetical protein